MSIYPQILIIPGRQNDTIGLTSTVGSVYITLTDIDTGQPALGNGLVVSWRMLINSVPGSVQTVSIIGTQRLIYNGLLSTIDADNGNTLNYYDFQIVDWDPEPPVTPPPNNTVCDATIIRVDVDQKESAPGAADAQVTIIATSSQLPLQYSLNGTIYQSSSTFTGLHSGPYTAYVSDHAGCTATLAFNIDLVQGLLLSDPSVGIGSGNISRWNAAFNPIVFTYQRKDFEVTGISADGNGNTIITVNANLTGVITNDMVYVCAGAYKGTYLVTLLSSNQLSILTPFIGADSNVGFININRLRSYYQVNIEIKYFDRSKNAFNIIRAVHRPDSTGLTRADLSSFLQSLLQAQDDSDFSDINFRDINLSACYTIRYAESWDGLDEKNWVWVNIADPYYVLYAAKQLGDAYGGNLAAYVPFPTVNSASKRALWVTDFAEPAYSNGYPFDIGFIYGEALAGLNIYCELVQLDINRQPITGSLQTSFLLNEDSSFLLNQDGSKLVIAGASAGNSNLVQHVGLNRLLINQIFGPETYYFTLTLKYNDTDNVTHSLTQTQTVRLDDMVDDQSVYLRWIGLSGSWNYYRFVYNQEISLDVQNAVIIKNYVSNWATQDGIEQVISKQAGQKMKVMAEDLSVADIKGLQSLKYSPKVQMLVNRNPVKWQTVVLNTATFAEYETRNGQAPFSVTFNLPSINIQTQ